MRVRTNAYGPGRAWLRSRGFATTLRYRVRRARKVGPLAAKLLLLPIDLILSIRRPSDAELPSSAAIGPGFHLPHPQGVVILQQARIGPHVSIFQQVTLGAWAGGVPRVKSRAVLYAGAKVIGGVIVGRRAFVGANAVVVADVPPWHVAIGVPAQAKRRKDVPEAGRTAFLKPEV